MVKKTMNPKTIICDIDGTLLKHEGDITTQHMKNGRELLLPGVAEIVRQWNRTGCFIVLLTGRKEGCREYTIRQLNEAGITFDVLVMGATSGQRYLINDKKINSEANTCFSINLKRNEGMENVRFD